MALAPFVTDLPIILVSVFALTRLGHFQAILGVVSLVGGIFLIYLAYLSFKTNKVNVVSKETAPQSLVRGTLVNFLSPNPYLFWLTVGAPNMVAAWTQGPWLAAGFLAGFYACLIGGKMSLAIIAAHSRRLLIGKAYGYVMRFLGGLLVIFAFLLFRDGIRFLTSLRP